LYLIVLILEERLYWTVLFFGGALVFDSVFLEERLYLIVFFLGGGL